MLLYGTKFGGKCLIGCLAAWALCVPAFPADSIPLITSVTQSTHAPQLTINGTNFGTALPAVTLNGQSASVLSYTNSVVVVTLPTAIESAPGTYILSLTNNSDSNYDLLRTAVFVAAIGTAGPAGTIGPAGPQGTPGSNGATGPAGATGATGATGPIGPSAVYINSSLNSNATITTSGAQVASLNNLPAGSYLLSAKVTIGFNSSSGVQDLCTLAVGGTPIDYSYATVSPSNLMFYETAKLLGTATLTSATNSITVTCSTTSGTATAQYPVLTATLAGNITPM